MIDRYLVRYFLAVVDQGNFSRAADRCSVAQPTLSVGIAKLEAALERRLFSRTNQRVELTEAGARFLVYARRIEREFNDAQSAMAEVSESKAIRIGVLSSVPGRIVAEAHRRRPAAQFGPLEILFGTERELNGQLERGRLDVALTIVRSGPQRYPQRAIIDEGYAMVMAIDHPFAERTQISAEALRHETMIVRRHCEVLSLTSRYFVERGVRPHFSLRTTNDERALQMVGAGVGITVMPNCYRAAGVTQVPLEGFDHRRTLGFSIADDTLADHPLLAAIEEALLSSEA